MTPSEFKAWFDGFCEAFDKTPSQKQWARIKERVAEIDGKPVTERVFVDRYWPQYIPYNRQPYLGYYSGPMNAIYGSTSNQNLAAYQSALQNSSKSDYSSTSAMHALGLAEAQAMTQ